jgi:predicted acyltransferase
MNRYLAVDFFRGLTIVFMIIVNTAGTGVYVYPPLRHAIWNGCTPTDLVFPSFMFIIGVSMWFAFAKYERKWSKEVGLKVLKRTALLFLIGLILNNFPFLWRNWDHWRIMGVPQRLALGYGLASVLVLNFDRKMLLWISAGLLLLYWGLLNWFGTAGLDPYSAEGSAVLRLDSWLFGLDHLYHEQVRPGIRIAFDPEGVLSTIPSIVTVVLGWLAGNVLSSRPNQKDVVARDLLVYGLILGFTGLFWDLFFPINKKLWTSSYVLYAGGISTVLLAAAVYLIDVRKWQNGAGFFTSIGTNPLFAYVLSEGLIAILYSIEWKIGTGETINAQEWIYQTIFRPIDATEFGSFLFALFYMLFCWAVCRYLFAKKIVIKL